MHRSHIPLPTEPSTQLVSSSGDPTHSPFVAYVDHIHLPIALRKVKCSTTSCPLVNFIFSFSIIYHNFVLSLSIMTILKSYEKALTYPWWVNAIEEEILVLKSCGT